jgi:biopolymer transport protein ExbD/biopolymer transport protein TolR
MALKVKAPPVNSQINVIPMADIMLVLLIIFMVVTPMLQKGMSVDLAPVDNPRDMKEADQDDAILVAVDRSGAVFLGTEKIDLSQVKAKVADLLANRVDKMVFVKSDLRAKYGRVVEVVDEVRGAGVDKLGLLTEKTRSATTAPAAAAKAPGQ